MASNNPRSPRQKMINLMYIVFIAMLALNTPIEVLNGFDLVENGLQQTIKSANTHNKLFFDRISDLYATDKVKTQYAFDHAIQIRKQADLLCTNIDDLKTLIVKKADGDKGNIHKIKNKDDLNAPSEVMLSPISKRGEKLRKEVDQYRLLTVSLLTDTYKKRTAENLLDTKPSKIIEDRKNWEEALFDQMPTSAAITLLTKLQSDIRATEEEVLSDLLANVGASDYRATTLVARAILDSRVVMEGENFTGQIVLTAEDTTKHPLIFIGNTPLAGANKGSFSFQAGAVGVNKTFSGYALWGRPGEAPQKFPFTTTYTVVPRMVTIEVANMNVLYTSINNKLSISVPGVSEDHIRASVTSGNASMSQSGNDWIVRPAKAGQDVIISVTADGKEVQKKTFKVRPLPPATPYIEYAEGGNPRRFKGGAIPKSTIVGATGVKAAIDDGLLDIPFTVIKFRTIFLDGMGNSIPEISSGSNFSERQKEQIRKLRKGTSFFISDVKAVGPDGSHDLAPIQITIK